VISAYRRLERGEHIRSLGGLGVWDTTVMAHRIRLLTAALRADECLAIQFKCTVGAINLLESQLSSTQIATRRGRRLDEGTHMISFRPTCFGARRPGAQKGPD